MRSTKPNKRVALKYDTIRQILLLLQFGKGRRDRRDSRSRLCRFSRSWVLAIALFGAPVYSAGKLEVIFYDNYYPYSYSENGEPTGLFVELTKLLMDRASVDASYRIYPFKRTMALGKRGVGLVSGLYRTVEREEFFYFSRPYYAEQLILLSKRKIPREFEHSGFSAIRGWHIGLLYGMSYGEQIDNAIADGTIVAERVENDLMNYEKLKRDRLDGVVIRRVLAQKLLDENGDEQMFIHPRTLFHGGVHIAVAKDFDGGEKILGEINNAIEKIKRDGSYQSILDGFLDQ